jgi:site-specific recombinase XerD
MAAFYRSAMSDIPAEGVEKPCSSLHSAVSQREYSQQENDMMTDWYQKSINALALNGNAGRTQEAYSRALRMLCEFYGKVPEEIGEAELEAYFLHRRNVDHWSPNTLRICYCGIRFYFVKVLQRDWNLFNFLRAKRESRLPAGLSCDEVRALLGCVRTPHNRAYLSTVYACGLRVQEALYLEVSDIDADRMMVHVHRGKAHFVPPRSVRGLPRRPCRCTRCATATPHTCWRAASTCA